MTKKEEYIMEQIQSVEEVNALFSRTFAIMTGALHACAIALLWAGMVLNSAVCYLTAAIMLFASALLIYFSVDYKTKGYIWYYIVSLFGMGLILFLACAYIYHQYSGALSIIKFIDALTINSPTVSV